MTALLRTSLLLALCVSFAPTSASAALRGVWDFITNGTRFNAGLPNGCMQPALRGGTITPSGGHPNVEHWFAFTTRSSAYGRETSREIWLGRNQDQVGFRVEDILDARRPLLRDPTGAVSYADPAWSPDGRYLAYVRTNSTVTETAIYVQEYANGTDSDLAATAVGAPLLVVAAAPGARHRGPTWSPDGSAIAYSSTASGRSLDIWVVAVDPGTAFVGTPERITRDELFAEETPAWGPGGRIVYATNRYGRGALEIVDLQDLSVRLAETNFNQVSHRNPSWSPDGASIYYDAPEDEDLQNNTDIWKLDLATQSKCDIYLDQVGDADPDVSRISNSSADGVPYHLFVMSSQAANFGLCIWRGSGVGCAPALPIGVEITPSTLNLGSEGRELLVTVTMPPETQAGRYIAHVDVSDKGGGIPAGFEGVKNRNTIVVSPTFLGMTAPTSEVNGSPYASVDNVSKNGQHAFRMRMDRKEIEARLVALGLVDRDVPCRVTAYSNIRGRQFSGFAYLRLNSKEAPGQLVRMLPNAPNPFNPVTKIRFSIAKPGRVTVRIYNIRGEQVAALAGGRYDAGAHHVIWNGASARGRAPSGVYFAEATAIGERGERLAHDVVKMVLAE